MCDMYNVWQTRIESLKIIYQKRKVMFQPVPQIFRLDENLICLSAIKWQWRKCKMFEKEIKIELTILIQGSIKVSLHSVISYG